MVSSLRQELMDILERGDISSVFQPVIDIQLKRVVGFEALSRGPEKSPLYWPDRLFDVAESEGLLVDLEQLCRRVAVEKFVDSEHDDLLLFLNVSPMALQASDAKHGQTVQLLQRMGIPCERVVIELSEKYLIEDARTLINAVQHYRSAGFKIALDDVGAGYSSLRLWSEVEPDIVKLDRHFVSGIESDTTKREFVRTLIELGQRTSTQVIVEGIETPNELSILTSLGMRYGQGYFFGYPNANLLVPSSLRAIPKGCVHPAPDHPCAADLIESAPAIDFGKTVEQAFDIFEEHKGYDRLAVVDEAMQPVGLLHLATIHELFAGHYGRALYSRKRILEFVDTSVHVMEANTSLESLAKQVVDNAANDWNFIVVEQGQYVGLGSVKSLLKHMTEMKIQAARYANPLTMLPGNVPIFEEIDSRLKAKASFYVLYYDLNNFKPYNDIYGYSRGDELLKVLAELIQKHFSDPDCFTGHIGGDDFVVVIGNREWEVKSRLLLEEFSKERLRFYDREDIRRGGIEAPSRNGERTFFPFIGLAIGVVHPDPDRCTTHHQVAELASEAKKMAKKQVDGGVFCSKRRGPDQGLMPDDEAICVNC